MSIKQIENLKIALIQTALHWQNKPANFALFTRLLANAEGAHIAILPEMFTTGFSMQPQDLFDENEGETLGWLRQQAQLHQMAICGSTIVKAEKKYYNQLYFVKPSGQYYTYRKRHLFTLAGEEKVYTPGNQKLIVNYLGWRINPQICYDLRFPVWCRNNENFDLQLFVANWPAKRRHAWQSLLVARAIENQCYVAGVNRTGTDGNDVPHQGDSCLIDPLGEIMWQAPKNKLTIKTLELSYPALQKTRKRYGFLKDQDRFLIT